MAGDSRKLPADVPLAALERVKGCVGDYAGLEIPDWVLASRLSERLRALGADNIDEYVALVTSDAGVKELELLLEAVRVGETRFFRHSSHVSALTDVVIPALRASRAGGVIRAWSAGCATGEEPYTLAMVLRKLLPRPAYDVKVVASDISADALACARAATYPESALAHVPREWQRWAFEPTADDELGRPRVKVADRVRRLVTLERRNLADGGFARGFDIIWCRNVLIYFSQEARERTIDALIRSLTDDGFLFLGYAETLRNFDRVEAVRAPDAVLYRKAPPARRPTPTPTPIPAPARPEPPVARRRDDVTAEEAVITLRGRYEGEERLTRELAAIMAERYASAVIELDGADYLGDGAASVLRRARSAARAAGMRLTFSAARPGTRRFLVRAGLLEEGEA